MSLRLGLVLFFTSLMACSYSSKNYATTSATDYFPKMSGCFLLYNLKTDNFEKTIGGERCREQLPAASTFKVPLAIMAFDSGILKNENVIYKWDGSKQMLPQWEKDHNAKTWMSDSVVWFSQRLTPKIGKSNLQKYLKAFHYGNQDLSAGITEAWLVAPSASTAALKISAYEQLEFLKNMWRYHLGVKNRAIDLTKKIMYLETSTNGARLSGKTGSHFYNKNKQMRMGWFISHVQKDEQEYLAVTSFNDLEPTAETSWGGAKAKEITKNILSDLQIW